MNKEIEVKEQPSDPLTGAKRGKIDISPYSPVPYQEITDAYVRVADYGRAKYQNCWNWSLGLRRTQIIGSMLRHTFAYLRGEDNDVESGLSHTDHILWGAVALTHSVHHDILDDREPEPERDYSKIKGKLKRDNE